MRLLEIVKTFDEEERESIGLDPLSRSRTETWRTSEKAKPIVGCRRVSMKKKRKKRRIDNGQPQLRNFSNLFRCQVVIVTYVPTMLVPFFRFRGPPIGKANILRKGRFLNEERDEFCGKKLCWIVLRFSLNFIIVLRVQ